MLKRTNTLNEGFRQLPLHHTRNRDAELPNSNFRLYLNVELILRLRILTLAGVFVRVNEGGHTPRGVIFAFQRRSSLFSEEKGLSLIHI